MNGKIKVMMTTEGTYPFHQGGVSTWCDILINSLYNNLDFTVYSIIMNPFVTQKFGLPKDTRLIKVPLWGTEEPCEHLDVPFSKVYLSKKITTDKVIKEKFLPLFIDLVHELISYDKNPKKFGNTLYELYKYFQVYEYKKSFKSDIIWKAYEEYVNDFTRNKYNKLEIPGSYSIIQSLGWIYRFMTVLNTPVPKVHVTHSAAAAFCGIPCVLAKLEHNAAFILTEHGVYLREQYLSLSKRGYTAFLNTFLIRMIHSVVNLNYFYADQVSPVCNYNTRWEERLGVERDKIEVIYNGVDKEAFAPRLTLKKEEYPTIVSVARIDPVKDIISLIKAADMVRGEIQEVRFVIYGSVSVPVYFEECKKLVKNLKLDENFIFAGHTNDVPGAYQSGDIIVLSSITEGFPYSVVEAMMGAKPVIATDVGGVKEAIGDCGVLVPPRQPKELAKSIITLLKNAELRKSLGEEGRERALSFFSIETVQEAYLKSYVKLALKGSKPVEEELKQNKQSNKNKHKLLIEKGYALLEIGCFEQAIVLLNVAIKEAEDLASVPIILTRIADAYNCLGEYDKALIQLEKAKAIMYMMAKEKTA